MPLVFVSRIEIYPVMVRGSKLTCFLCRGQIGFVFGWGPKFLGCNVWIEIDMVLVWAQQMTCFQCGDRLTWFLCGWSKLTFISKWGIELDLILV